MHLRHRLPAFRTLTLLLALSCSGLPFASAATLSVVQDNYVQNGSPDAVLASNGAGTTFVVAARDSLYNRKAYLGFDLTGVLQSNQEFENATLSLTSSALVGAAGSFTDVSFNVYGITGATAWSESTITWNNAPYNNTSSAIALNSSGTVLLGSFSVTLSTAVNQTHTLTAISGSLATYLNWAVGLLGDHYGTGVTSLDTPSLVLTSSTGPNSNLPGITFHSSEATNAAYQPTIIFDTVAIPEPATAAFLSAVSALGLTLVVRRSRRT